MRILVIGSRGTIGTPLVQHLRQEHEVWEADLEHCAGTEHADGEERYLRCDISEFRQATNALLLSRPELVINLAAEFGRINGSEFYEQLWRTNCIGLRNLLEFRRLLADACEQHRFFLVHISSSEVYGEPLGRTDNEDFCFADDPLQECLGDHVALFPKNDYAISKLANELQLRNEPQDDWCCLRIFNAYGPGEEYTPRRSVVTQFIYRLLHGLPITVYSQCHRDFLYIDDLIDTLARIPERLERVRGRFINVGGNNYHSIEELHRMVACEIAVQRHLGVGAQVGGSLHFEKTEPGNCVHKCPDNTLCAELLDHAPKVDLAEGLKRTVAWHLEHYADTIK